MSTPITVADITHPTKAGTPPPNPAARDPRVATRPGLDNLLAGTGATTVADMAALGITHTRDISTHTTVAGITSHTQASTALPPPKHPPPRDPRVATRPGLDNLLAGTGATTVADMAALGTTHTLDISTHITAAHITNHTKAGTPPTVAAAPTEAPPRDPIAATNNGHQHLLVGTAATTIALMVALGTTLTLDMSTHTTVADIMHPTKASTPLPKALAEATAPAEAASALAEAETMV
jgi:hypothetical protein